MHAKLVLMSLLLLSGAIVAAPVPKPGPIPPVNADHLKSSRENLKQIGLATHNFHDANAVFPGNINSKDGKPLLSWRVAILPYMEEENLYKQFKLDEPWDSENNKKLIEKMPKIYAPIRVQAPAGKTFYQAFTGKNALIDEKGKNRSFTTITDGTSNTAFAVEAGESVIWTKPEDIAFDAEKAVPKLGGLFDGEFHVLLCDGSVTMYKKDFDADEMKKVIQPNDGYPVDAEKLEKKNP